MRRSSFCCLLFISATAMAGGDLLPDLQMGQGALNGNQIDVAEMPGRILFRFDTHIRNFGPGELILDVRGAVEGDGRQEVDQVIEQDGGGERRRDAGDMRFDTVVRMMESPGWVDYRIRAIEEGGAVGEILREGGKPAANITSTTWFNLTLPNAVQLGQPTQDGGSPPHGISVGWYDLYQRSLPLQWIDVTGLIAGDYWLEAEVDPGNNIEETDDFNNAARVMVTLDHALMPKAPGDANGDGTTDAVDIQSVINGALGLSVLPAIVDIDGNGVIDAVDVQLTINGALGV